FWQNLRAGVCSITAIPAERRALFRAQGADGSSRAWGGFLAGIDCFDSQFFGISDAEAVQMDPQHRLFLEVCWHALEHAGYAGRAIEGTRTGIFVGLSGSQYVREYVDRLGEVTGDFGLGNAASILANRTSYLLNPRGPSLVVDTACSSSLVAAH